MQPVRSTGQHQVQTVDHFRSWRTVGHEQDSRTPSQQQRRDEVQHAGLRRFQEVLTEDMSPFNPLAPLRPQTNTKAGGRQHTSALSQPPSCTAVMRAAQVVETDSLEARGRRETAQVSCATRYGVRAWARDAHLGAIQAP